MGRRRLFNDKEKWCNKCSSWKTLDLFGRNCQTASGRQDYCKGCHAQPAEYFRQYNYDLSPDEYQKLFDEQQGRCKICQKVKKLCVDHNHKTGVVRGLLCKPCNTMLGVLSEDPTNFERAIQYLKADYAL